jgi:predicted nucleotidyltransferase
MVEEIVDELDPEQIILFGSLARESGGPASDVDLLVVSTLPFGQGRSRRRQTANLYRRLAHSGVPKDILLVSRPELARWRDCPNHVIARALREGRVLYERA